MSSVENRVFYTRVELRGSPHNIDRQVTWAEENVSKICNGLDVASAAIAIYDDEGTLVKTLLLGDAPNPPKDLADDFVEEEAVTA